MLAAVVYLCGELMATTIFAAAQPWVVPTFLACFQGAAAVIAATYASAVIYFAVLVRGEERDNVASGTSLTFAAVLLAALAYTVVGSIPLL